MKAKYLLTEHGLDAEGLVDPTCDTGISPPLAVCQAVRECGLSVPCVVWAKLVGFTPLWTPALISYIYRDGECAVFFLSRALYPVSGKGSKKQKNSTESILPSWHSESLKVRPYEEPVGPVQFSFIPVSNVLSWEGVHKEGFLTQVKNSSKSKLYTDSILLGDELNADGFIDRSVWPPFFVKDHLLRSQVEGHSLEQESVVEAQVRPALRLHHLKLFIETNLIELHWRTIAHARQFVKAVPDEIFGGYHLIAAQDWPTDRDVSSGVGDVFLVYVGNILSYDEANQEESETVLHQDLNRYVAEIPNTSEIFDKKKNNLNHTGKNLYVDGLKYADPCSPLWAPAPTVNHERVEYCKLEPHHVCEENNTMRGFWLQRKKGAVIYKGEPLFWSYDCGAGKFDSDFNLTPNTPPPIGWRPNPSSKPNLKK